MLRVLVQVLVEVLVTQVLGGMQLGVLVQVLFLGVLVQGHVGAVLRDWRRGRGDFLRA